jgi:hypothetical protein
VLGTSIDLCVKEEFHDVARYREIAGGPAKGKYAITIQSTTETTQFLTFKLEEEPFSPAWRPQEVDGAMAANN